MSDIKQKDLSVLLPVCEMGGFGDLIAGMAIGEYLEEKGVPFKIFFDDIDAQRKFKKVSKNSAGLNWTHYDLKKSKDSGLIVIYPVKETILSAIRKQTDYKINIEEYGIGFHNESDFKHNHVFITTGLFFNNTRTNVQSGIFIRKNLDFLLESVDQAVTGAEGTIHLKKMALDSLLQSYSSLKLMLFEKYGDPEKIIRGDWSFVYTSTLDNDWQFLDILSAAEPKLEKPLYVFIPQNKTGTTLFKEKIKNFGFSYVNPFSTASRKTSSPITIINLGAIPDYSFRQILACADKLSVVTGDQSLSQMMQKANSKTHVPFLYHKAHWKNGFVENLSYFLEKSSPKASQIFTDYHTLCRARNVEESERRRITQTLPKLLYDGELIKEYADAFSHVKNVFVREKQEAGVAEAEKLWCVQETVGYIVQGIMAGKTMFETVEPLLPKKESLPHI